MSASAQSEIGKRYAAAFFDLAVEEKKLEALEKDLNALGALLTESADLKSLISNPVFDRDTRVNAMAALLDKAGAEALTKNLAGLLARNGRLNVLPAVITAFKKMAADTRGEVSAEAISAVALSDDQATRLRTEIEASLGKAVNLEIKTDKDLLGGMIVKVGSRMVDSSLRTKLNRLKLAMKEA